MLKRAGSPDQLALTELPAPVPGPGDVLVGVHAATVTRGDVVMRKMPRLVTRLVGETPKSILGHEFAGDIEAVGADVNDFRVGDRVFGTTTGLAQGSYAEYIALPERGMLATIPEGISYEDAAPVPVGAMTALHFLREGSIDTAKRVLVNGASGSVGSFAVQIAKRKGAHVTGVSSTSNTELVAGLGADDVIDYRTQDFTEGGQTYDLVFDAAGKTSARRSRNVLGDSGRFVTTQRRRRERVEELREVRDMLASGSIRALVDRCYTLDQIPEAHRDIEEGRKRGNVVVRAIVEEGLPSQWR